MFSDQPLEINIEYRGVWYEWDVRYKDRILCGYAKELKVALDHVLKASARITETRLNPPRNP